MDIVDDVMRLLRVRSRAAYRICRDGDWARRIEDGDLFRLHCLLEGQCFGKLAAGGRWYAMRAGDVLVVPRGGATRIQGTRRSDVEPTGHRLAQGFVDDGQQAGAQRVLLLGATVEFAGATLHPLITGLPEVTLIPHAAFLKTGSRRHAGYLVDQLLPDSHGTQAAVIDRLVEILLMQVIRAHQTFAGPTYRFMGALLDPPLRRAIVAIHLRPGHNWSLERLAEVARLSRSAFSRRFSDQVGVAAMHYLTLWRMQTAIGRLRSGHADSEAIAREVGYRSAAAFQKAFKRVHGVTPAQAAARSAGPATELPREILSP